MTSGRGGGRASELGRSFAAWRAICQVLAIGVLSFLSALAVGCILRRLGLWTSAQPGAYPDPFAAGPTGAVWRVVVAGPLFETLVLGFLYTVCSTAFAPRAAAAMAGLAVAGMHFVKGWPAAVCAVIPFLILAMPFASPRLSWRAAAVRSAAIHAVHNACVVLFAALATAVLGEGALAPGQ